MHKCNTMQEVWLRCNIVINKATGDYLVCVCVIFSQAYICTNSLMNNVYVCYGIDCISNIDILYR